MNGARSIFMRKGYWLTALATAVLLAASPGTVLAQGGDIGIKSVKVDAANSANEVNEGTTTTVTVTLTKEWTEASAAEVKLVIGVPMADGDPGVSGEQPGGKGNIELTGHHRRGACGSPSREHGPGHQ